MEIKAGPASVSILGGDLAAMGFNDRADDGQAHAETFLFRGKELLEKSFACCLGNAGAVITHGNATVALPLLLVAMCTLRRSGGMSRMASKALLTRLISTC